ncbi:MULTISPECIES: hypothetical protein [Leptospira]|uniref:Uncharacterized protein n=2 Tax=Leptospira TaxID=171 RepID=A0A6H3NU06_9LEPT|nr:MULTISPECIES: hypothetical protein [Leptospira]MCW7467890.1 hypothetical protein [Leptospira levettii]MCW7513414.1 hypothetical protein [Leptospira levettii]MCW7517200.1 hypothetical protein [Leptospira levettii]TGN13341.1 hypothetical protein EHR08_11720 [Leptospira bandrabouensis]
MNIIKIAIFSYIILQCISCGFNQGIDSKDFYTEDETERKIGIAVYIKSLQMFGNAGALLPYQFQEDPNCRRQSYFKKDQVTKCMNIILASSIQATDISDYFGKIGVIINKVCNLERQIFLDNSAKGEINFCGVK